jgi:hypothetical protein
MNFVLFNNCSESEWKFFIVVGPAAGVCAEMLRLEGFLGQIVVATKEYHLPYDRPKLSKVWLDNDYIDYLKFCLWEVLTDQSQWSRIKLVWWRVIFCTITYMISDWSVVAIFATLPFCKTWKILHWLSIGVFVIGFVYLIIGRRVNRALRLLLNTPFIVVFSWGLSHLDRVC